MDPESGYEVDARVALAAERTVLAWYRTGIALMGFGFVVARFGLFLRELAAMGPQRAEPPSHASTVGIVLVGAGIVVNVWAAVRHLRMIQHLASGRAFRATPAGPVALGIASGVGGVVLVAIMLSAQLR